ncbi:hypothetical protein Acsp05_29990 [Actinokineospora sp. NBRC 105648]|nr:hypothetical protein Acsp05_29990 [Actinokineospora sp. NBRC 105648]
MLAATLAQPEDEIPLADHGAQDGGGHRHQEGPPVRSRPFGEFGEFGGKGGGMAPKSRANRRVRVNPPGHPGQDALGFPGRVIGSDIA